MFILPNRLSEVGGSRTQNHVRHASNTNQSHPHAPPSACTPRTECATSSGCSASERYFRCVCVCVFTTIMFLFSTRWRDHCFLYCSVAHRTRETCCVSATCTYDSMQLLFIRQEIIDGTIVVLLIAIAIAISVSRQYR